MTLMVISTLVVTGMLKPTLPITLPTILPFMRQMVGMKVRTVGTVIA